MTDLALGACRFGTWIGTGTLSGVEYTRQLSPGLTTHAQREPYYTPLPAGAMIVVSAREECRIENLPMYANGKTSIVAAIAVDFGDRLERRSFSVTDVNIDSNSAP